MKADKGIRFCVVALILVISGNCTKEISFTAPVIITTPLSNITSASIVSGGDITSDGGSDIIAKGVCWSKTSDPTINDNHTLDGAGLGSFLSSVTGLISGTYYYLRAYATNNMGTSYGNEFNFVLPIADADGNLYNTLRIGTQIWMTMNLKTSRYNDSTLIPKVVENADWSTISTPSYCWYQNVNDLSSEYGALYNWYAVSTGKLCPSGFHVPSEQEWVVLTDFLNGEYWAGGKLKETGTNHWMSPNAGATNDFNFSALPGGFRTGLAAGTFRASGYLGYYWASSEADSIYSRARLMTFDTSELVPGYGLKSNGFSVRCIKD